MASDSSSVDMEHWQPPLRSVNQTWIDGGCEPAWKCPGRSAPFRASFGCVSETVPGRSLPIAELAGRRKTGPRGDCSKRRLVYAEALPGLLDHDERSGRDRRQGRPGPRGPPRSPP